jgi:hypothetical protein
MGGWIRTFREAVIESPFTWFLLALLALVDNHRKGVEIDRLCELAGSHDSHPSTASEKFYKICVDPQPDD